MEVRKDRHGARRPKTKMAMDISFSIPSGRDDNLVFCRRGNNLSGNEMSGN
jgi:hypothetical protein